MTPAFIFFLTYPFYISIQAEDIKDFVSVDFRWLEAINHEDRRVSMGTILWRWRSVCWAIALAPTTASTHTRSQAVWRGAIILIVVSMKTSLRAT